MMQDIMHWFFEMRPFEQISSLLSSLMIIAAFVAAFNKKLRKWLRKKFEDEEEMKARQKENERLFEASEKTERRLDCIEVATVTLLHDRLYTACKYQLRRGYTTTEELDNIEHMYSVYHDKFGGNGTGTKLVNDVRSLPIK